VGSKNKTEERKKERQTELLKKRSLSNV